MTEAITVTRGQVQWVVLEYIDSLAPAFKFTKLSTSEPIRTTIVAKQLTEYLFNNVKERCPECACPWDEHTIPVVSSLPPGWLKAYFCSGCGTCQEEPPEPSRRLTIINPWQEQDNEVQADPHVKVGEEGEMKVCVCGDDASVHAPFTNQVCDLCDCIDFRDSSDPGDTIEAAVQRAELAQDAEADTHRGETR